VEIFHVDLALVADHIQKRNEFHAFAFEPGHHAVLIIHQCFNSFHAHSRSQQAVIRSRRSAALNVTEDRHASLESHIQLVDPCREIGRADTGTFGIDNDRVGLAAFIGFLHRETGLLATVFTPPELIEKHVYMLISDTARDWALSAGIQIPPTTYDAIQAPPVNPTANITSPELFADMNGAIKIIGTASGENFEYYRVQVGKGLNPQEWIQLGSDATAPVENGVLAEWDTKGLSGLYAVQLLVVRSDQKVDTTVIQVTIK
jgi:hypothetical protein